VQRILQKHVGRGEFVDNAELADLTPEVGEPTPDTRTPLLAAISKPAARRRERAFFDSRARSGVSVIGIGETLAGADRPARWGIKC
jgi:hypothetical protein